MDDNADDDEDDDDDGDDGLAWTLERKLQSKSKPVERITSTQVAIKVKASRENHINTSRKLNKL